MDTPNNTEDILHLKGWLDDESRVTTREVQVKHIQECVPVNGACGGHYSITFLDQFGVSRKMNVTIDWKNEIVGRKASQVLLTIREVVISARIVLDSKLVHLKASFPRDVGRVD